MMTLAGSVTTTAARRGLPGKMAHDDLVCRHQFPPAVIRHAVWLYMRFTLGYRDVEYLLAERGLDISYETVRGWVLKSGPLFARELRRPSGRWLL
jgi:putative transposase